MTQLYHSWYLAKLLYNLSQRYLHMFIVVLVPIAKKRHQSSYPSRGAWMEEERAWAQRKLIHLQTNEVATYMGRWVELEGYGEENKPDLCLDYLFHQKTLSSDKHF